MEPETMLAVNSTHILRTMVERDLDLFGDPSGQILLYLLQRSPRLHRRKTSPKVQPVEPRARDCAELLERGLIEPVTDGNDSGKRRFQPSSRGLALLGH
jgi:hypothetical protein